MATPIEGGEVQGTGPEGGDGGTPGQNPAWNDVLGVIPSDLHAQVTPYFQQWDQSAQQRVESVNEQLSTFKPFIDNSISSEDLEQGLQLMYQLNTNPQGVYEALASTYGYGNVPPVSQEGETEEEGETFQDPRFDDLQQGLDLVAQTLLQQEQQKLQTTAAAEIDAEVASLKESHPGISEEFIYSLMVNGFDAKSVGEKWTGVTQNILQQNPRPFAPQVLGSSGGGTGLPSQAIDPRKLDGKATRSLVEQMVRQQMAD